METPGLTAYTYAGTDTQHVTVGDTDAVLTPGQKVYLPAGHPYTAALVEAGTLAEVPAKPEKAARETPKE